MASFIASLNKKGNDVINKLNTVISQWNSNHYESYTYVKTLFCLGCKLNERVVNIVIKLEDQFKLRL